MSITEPDQVWCSDITYIRLAHGFVYLTAVLDWASRYVLSWEVSVTMDADFCVNALKSALRKHQTPEIFNTDRVRNIQGRFLRCTKKIMAFKAAWTLKGAVWII